MRKPTVLDEAKSLGLTLTVLRRYRGLTLRALSKATGSTHSNLSSYETGRTLSRHDTLVRMVKALDVTLVAFWRAQALIDEATGAKGPEPPPARLEPTSDRPTAVRLAQEIGKTEGHVTLSMPELGARWLGLAGLAPGLPTRRPGRGVPASGDGQRSNPEN